MTINVMFLQDIRIYIHPSDAVEANTRVTIFPPAALHREG